MSSNEPRERRGFVTLVLHANYPEWTVQRALERQVGPFYAAAPGELERDISYLQERGYLVHEERVVGRAHLHTYRLTAAGVDIAERTTHDAGVEILAG